MMNKVPIKIHWNITNMCLLNCRFCSKHLDKSPELTNHEAKAVISKIANQNVKIIVFTGGDPLCREDIYDLVKYAHNVGLITVMDTTALGLSRKSIRKLNDDLNWIGIPLDGSSPENNATVRGNSNHFYNVMRALHLLRNKEINIKINTMVNKINLADIVNIGMVIKNFPVKLWSLYQFWPIEKGERNSKYFYISREDFENEVQNVKMHYPLLSIEAVGVHKRQGSYFFISPSGKIYNTGLNNKSYEEVGNILNDDIKGIWNSNFFSHSKQEHRLSTKLELSLSCPE